MIMIITMWTILGIAGLMTAIVLVSVYFGFWIAKQGYTYSVPALGNPNGPDTGLSVTPYDQDPMDEAYSLLGNLGEFDEEDEADPVHATVARMMEQSGVAPHDTLGPEHVPSEPFVGDGVEEIEDDNR
jgi:hypothetical protein